MKRSLGAQCSRSRPSAALPMVGLILALQLGADCAQVTLRDVCANTQAPIESVQDFARILSQLDAGEQFEICKRYRLAFDMLRPIIMNTDHQVCGDEKFALMERFHSRFISAVAESGEPADRTQDNLAEQRPREHGAERADRAEDEAFCPISLQQLFKAYAMQASGLCKQRLAKNIELAMREMDDDDHDTFAVFKFRPADETRQAPIWGRASELDGDKRPEETLASFVQNPDQFTYNLSFKELVHLPELEGELERAEARGESTQMDLRDKPELNKFLLTCRKRFRPVYSKLILPIVRLAKLGYDYVGSHLDRYQDKLESDLINEWLLATLICESHANFELVAGDHDAQGAAMDELHFELLRGRPIDGKLWIKDPEELAFEFKLSSAFNQGGFQKFLANSQLAARKVNRTLNPKRLDFYKQHERSIGAVMYTLRTFSQLVGKFGG